MKMRWFGRTWHAPMNDDLEHVLTPVGSKCLFCEEPIGETDRGVIMGAFVRDNTGSGNVVSPEPVHLFCYLRNTLGRGIAAQMWDRLLEREGDGESP